MMKRVCLIGLCLAMMLSLCACDLEEITEEPEIMYISVAQASMYVMSLSRESGDDYVGISANGLDTSQKLVDECVVMMRSNRVMTDTIAAYKEAGGEHIPDADALREAVHLESVEQTALMRITVYPFAEGVTDEEMLLMCESLLSTSQTVVGKAMSGLLSMEVLDPPAIQKVEESSARTTQSKA